MTKATDDKSQAGVGIDPAAAFFLMAVLFLTAAGGWLALRLVSDLGLVLQLPESRWTMLHFITIGAATEALFGSLPALAARHAKAAVSVSRRSRWLQWLLLNGGWVLVLLGMGGGSAATAATGAVVIIAAVLLLMWDVNGLLRGATAPAASYYRWAPAFFLVGLAMAIGMLYQWWAPGGYFGMLEAHVHANVWGFLALVAAGTLYLLVPAYVQKPLARPQWQRPTFWLLSLGAFGLVAGPWLTVHVLTFGGLALYAAGVVMLLTNLILTMRGGDRSAAAHHLVWAYLWMIVPVPLAPFVLLMPEVLPAGRIEAAATVGLVYGWILQMLMGALPWIIRRLRDPVDGEIPAPVQVRSPLASLERGTVWSVVLVNAGGALWWLNALLPEVVPVDAFRVGGFLLVGAAVALFLRRPVRALLDQREPEPPAVASGVQQ